MAFTITHPDGELADGEPRQLADGEPRPLTDDEPRHLAGVSRAEAVRIMTLLATGGDVESLEWLPGYR